jgi:hypothetical protein
MAEKGKFKRFKDGLEGIKDTGITLKQVNFATPRCS